MQGKIEYFKLDREVNGIQDALQAIEAMRLSGYESTKMDLDSAIKDKLWSIMKKETRLADEVYPSPVAIEAVDDKGVLIEGHFFATNSLQESSAIVRACVAYKVRELSEWSLEKEDFKTKRSLEVRFSRSLEKIMKVIDEIVSGVVQGLRLVMTPPGNTA